MSFSPIRLRPHHLLCLQTFRGNGYSPGFVRKMTELSLRVQGEAKALRPDDSAPAAPVLLVSGADDLCGSCPHCADGQCTSPKPAVFDELVLARTGFTVSRLLPEGLRSEGIPAVTRELLEACCPGCDWLPLCREICAEYDRGR